MKNKLISIALTLLLFSGCQKNDSHQGSAPLQTKSFGHEQGNATDNPPSGFGGAWMLGDENIINYCYIIAPDFGADVDTIKNELQTAFGLWKTYITVKKVNEALEKAYISSQKYNPYPLPESELLERAKKFRLSTRSNILSSCDGTENVKFYFGTEDDDVTLIKQSYFNPTAFAHRVQFDEITGVGHGFIWLSQQGGLGPNIGNYPDWSQKNRLRGVLVHEIGHFYGVGHIEGTIMQENMFGLLLKPDRTSMHQDIIEYKMAHIDHEKELYYPQFEENEHTYQGQMSLSGKKNDLEANANFELMTGQKANGPVVAQFLKRKLTISDSLAKYDFEILFDEHATFDFGKAIFNGNREWKDTGIDHQIGAGMNLPHASLSAVGEVQTKNGAKLPVVLEVNMNFSSVQIYTIVGGHKTALMISNYLSMGL